MSAKIKDVAKKANVSIATVSRVINNVPLVNQETKDRVLEAIKETGYRPNAIARSLKLQKTETVGVVIHDITIPYYAQMARGVQDISMQSGYNAIICNSDADSKKEEEFMDLFYQKQCDGIIFAGRELDENVKRKFEYMNMPVILCGVEDFDGKYSSVINDYNQGIHALMLYVKNKGHKNIGLIHGDKNRDYNAKKNEEVIMSTAKELGMKFDKSCIIENAFTMKGGYLAMKEMFKRDLPSVVICGNDEMAVGAIKAIEEKGMKVPDDISIVSLNSCEVGRWINPTLTSINHYMYDVGAISARLLVKLLEGEDLKEKKIIVSHGIIEGESVKDLNK
ncbi:LacI family DNA-binding transcriptional regulator [Anaerofustis sp.]|uniref:LacI family DNA-binding transcriptional regulator n=1 Tax=Anaerofustis sp. TaxID=1872517 RepID=UPI0025B9E11F|nr:LacI family DNA-binding transcriptional regulator [Anaerofustis sp.]